MLAIGVILIIIPILHNAQGKIFSKCELAGELLKQGFPKSEINDWLCLVEGESTFNTEALNKYNWDGSWDWGIFQINDRWWCDGGNGKETANVCGISCNEFLQDDISVSVKCAKRIKQIHNFDAWVAWKNHCSNGRNLTDANDCF